MTGRIRLSPLISNGMVLQRDSRVRIWGKGTPDKELTLKFLNREYRTKVNEDGTWNIYLYDLKPGGPYDMVIDHDNDKKVIKDVLIGDVWVLGGQSNMQITVSRTLDLFEEEVKGASYPEIRQFTVPMVYNFNGPSDELSGGKWIPVTPETVYDFSAVGYFFSKKIYDKYKVPIGLLLTAIGGTPAEAWISEKTLRRFGRFTDILKKCKDESYIRNTIEREKESIDNWYQELNIKDEGLHDKPQPWYSDSFNDSDWMSIELPASFKGTELEPVRGSVWFRKEIDLPDSLAGREGKLALGTLIDADDTYVNGVRVGNTGYLYPPRRYKIPAGLLKAGKNIIAVRLIMTSNIGGFVTDMPYYLMIGDSRISLSGTWRYKIGAVTRPLSSPTFFEYKPAGVYNGMIYPLRNYSVRGILWYQGESNTGYPYDYKELFEAVINDWRKLWNLGDIPFYYVQLPNYCPWKIEPEVSGWAVVRDAQRRILEMPNTGMAVTIDVGMYNDLHPWDKKSVGERLALWAFNQVYGEDIVYSGPIYDRMVIEGSKVRIYFKYTDSGLVVKGDRLESFEICGSNKIYYPAEAEIEDNSVVVYSKKVPDPVRVRYAWADNPEKANLYNKEGLPASPFITGR